MEYLGVSACSFLTGQYHIIPSIIIIRPIITSRTSNAVDKLSPKYVVRPKPRLDKATPVRKKERPVLARDAIVL